MKNFIQPGAVMPYTAGADILSGEAIEVVDLLGVATGKILNGETGELLLCGVVELKKEAALAINQGDKVYYDTAAKEIDKTNTNVFAGYCFESALAAATTVKIYLMQQGA